MNPSRSAIAIAVAAALASVAHAQQAEDRVLEEIIVTAQKRAQNLQDVPFSVAAVTAEDMRESGSTNIVELARNVSGLAITDLGPGQSQVAIRGISAGQVIRDQPGVKESVGIYLDESPISVALFTPDLDLYDLERFEVLRGPQGTLFGAGSSSGTLRYITAQPNLSEFEGGAELNLQQGTDADFGGAIKGMVNVPVGDTAALRAVAYYNELAGFVDSVYPGRNVEEDVDGGQRVGGRIAFLLQPSETLSITPRVVYQKLETDGYPRVDVFNILGNPFTTTQPAVDPGERGQVTQLQEGIEDDFGLFDLRVELALGGATLTSVSSYTDREVIVTRDASQLTGSVTFDLSGTAAEVRLNSPLIDTTQLEAFSQELRLSSNQEGDFDWLVGAFYQTVDREYGQRLPTPGYDAFLTRIGLPTSAGFNAPADMPFFSDLTYDFSQIALFGEGTYRFSDQLSLTGGLRYYDFEEDRLLTFAGVFADLGYQDEPGETSSDGFSPRLILAFEPNDDLLFTAQVARGFRLGGINDPLNVPLCSASDLAAFSGRPTWEDEKVLNYELGAKTQLADGRVGFNVSAFYSDIDGLQAIGNAGTCSSRVVFNAQAESIGGEVELFARPSDNLDLAFTATYVQAEITESVVGPTGQPIAGIREGNRLPTSPELQAAASATYSWPWSTDLDAYVNFTVQHVGSSYTLLADQEPNFGIITSASGAPAGAAGLRGFGAPSVNTVTFDPELPAYEIGNLRFGVRAEQWEAALFINNVWDERAFLSLDRERDRAARVSFLTNQPRTYGVNLRYNF
jgi:iron complex outermembrane recepter protein